MATEPTEMVAVEVWVLIDGDGDYVAHKDREALMGEYESLFTSLTSEVTTRYVKLTVHVPKPRPVELVATVAAEPDAAELHAA